MTEPSAGRVGRAAYWLGLAGLLPQAAILIAAAWERDTAYSWLAFAYASLILSFVGGIWWSMALRRSTGQSALLVASVVASLLPMPLLFWGASRMDFTWPLVTVGAAVVLTLLVDHRLTRTEQAPSGWMRLRVPLSVGLGLLSIAIAIVEA